MYVIDGAISTIGAVPANIPVNILGGAINELEFIMGPVPAAFIAEMAKV